MENPKKIVINKAIDILKTKGWCQGAFARTRDFWSCSPKNKEAMSFCLMGAIERARYETGIKYDRSLIRRIEKTLPQHCIPEWNDMKERTKEDVIALLEKVKAEL